MEDKKREEENKKLEQFVKKKAEEQIKETKTLVQKEVTTQLNDVKEKLASLDNHIASNKKHAEDIKLMDTTMGAELHDKVNNLKHQPTNTFQKHRRTHQPPTPLLTKSRR